MAQAPDHLIVEKFDEGFAILTLNRPQAMNALSAGLRIDLANTVREMERDPSIRVLVLTGAGRAFCAGLDLKELGATAAGLQTGDFSDAVKALEEFSGAIICAINGPAVTGGFEVALACDILIASEEAKFADTHVRVGVLPDWGLSQKLSRAIGIYRAKELSLTGNFLSARQAEAWGLVNRVVPAADLISVACALARDILSAPAAMTVAMKHLINHGFTLGFGDALEFEHQQSSQHNLNVDPSNVSTNRAAIQERGRRSKDAS